MELRFMFFTELNSATTVYNSIGAVSCNHLFFSTFKLQLQNNEQKTEDTSLVYSINSNLKWFPHHYCLNVDCVVWTVNKPP